jgi:hypothetical protein
MLKANTHKLDLQYLQVLQVQVEIADPNDSLSKCNIYVTDGEPKIYIAKGYVTYTLTWKNHTLFLEVNNRGPREVKIGGLTIRPFTVSTYSRKGKLLHTERLIK